uniref:Transposase n=1 Tax=Macrostomum lignano TaxID=282301 RepID=A0A1I8F5X0_9PLAT
QQRRPDSAVGERQGLGRSQPGVQVAAWPGGIEIARTCWTSGCTTFSKFLANKLIGTLTMQPAAAVAGKPCSRVAALTCERLIEMRITHYSGERACDHVFLQWLSQWDIC